MELVFLIEANKTTLSGLSPEKTARRQKYLQYLDGGIVFLASGLCGFISQYYTEAVAQKYILVGLFAAIALYYASKLFRN
jgi:hypothetical protein